MSHKHRPAMLLLTLVCLLFLLTPAARAGQMDVRFPLLGKDIAWTVPFDDQLFTRDGQTYHQDTALASLGMALSAFRVHKGDLSNRGVNIRGFLQQAGFADVLLEEFDIEPNVQTIATAIGRKVIQTDGGPRTLVAIAVSGGGYIDEWKSNFTVGNGVQHEGFDHAARKVHRRLIAYANQHDLADYKVWISGYSRAAATSNRAAALMLDSRMVEPQDLYAYTFATPNVTRQQNAASYPSIYNVVGAFDPVPMVPFGDWGFVRYGQTFYLPGPEINSDYTTRIAPLLGIYRDMTGTEFWNNTSSNSTLQKVLSAVSESVPDTQAYQSNMQSFMVQLWTNRNNPGRMLLGTVTEIIKAPDFRNSMGKLGNQVMAILSNASMDRAMQETGVLKDEWTNDGDLTANLGHEHFPTVYLAWMSAYKDPAALFTSSLTYRQVRLYDVDSVRVTNEQGEVAALYELQEEQDITQGSLPMALSGEELVITVPADRAYRVELVRQPEDKTALAVREGLVGRIRMANYEASDADMGEVTTVTLDLPAMSAWAEEDAYTLRWTGGQAPLKRAAIDSNLSQLEMNSGVRSFVGQNLRSALILLVGAVLLVFFYLFIAGRAVKAARNNHRLRKADCTPEGYRRHRILKNPGKGHVTWIKVLSLLLMIVSLAMVVLSVALFVVWRNEFGLLGQSVVFWYATLYLLPLSLAMLFTAVPALLAGLHNLLWRGGLYRLRSARLFAQCSLVFAVIQLFLFIADENNAPNPLYVGVTVVQMLLLGSILWLSRSCRRQENAANRLERE